MAESTPDGGVVQLHVPSVDPNKRYLGDASVVHDFVGGFARDAMASYGQFLAGKAKADEVQPELEQLARKYGDALMGRDPNYEIAPWQGKRLTGKFLAAIPSMKGDDEPGEALFRHLAVQCVKASLALRDGKSDKQVGEQLKGILDDARGRILGTIQ